MTCALYDRIGGGYDATRRADGRIVDGLARGLDLRVGGRYLDLGCGSGNYGAALRARGAAIVGLDRSTLMLVAARTKHPELPLLHADGAAVPLRDGCLDGAFVTLAIHHFRAWPHPSARCVGSWEADDS